MTFMTKKKVIMIIMVVGVGMISPHIGRAGILPHDMATIEALIEQSKIVPKSFFSPDINIYLEASFSLRNPILKLT